MRIFRSSLPLVFLVASISGTQAQSSAKSELSTHLAKAQAALAAHQPAQAIPELQAAVPLDPNNLEVRANLGVLLFFQGQYAEALPHLKAAVAGQPELWKIRALLGIAERRVGEEAAGRDDLEAVFPHVEEQKLKISVGRELVESYAASDDLDKAAETIGALLKLAPTDPALLYISYRIHSDMSVAALLELGLAAPESAQTHQAIAHELQREHDLPATIANLREALKLDQTLPGIHFELAEALHASDDQRQRSEAKEQYELAVKTSPGDAKAATRLGDVEVEEGQLDAAALQYGQALKLQPASVDAAVGMANVLFQQNKTAEALPLLERAEASDPTNALAHFRLSAVYRKLGRPDDVKRELDLYKHYKDERERLKKVYQQMRVVGPQNDTEK